MQLCIINHLKQINMKNFILLWLVVLTGSLWAQATKTPEIVVPTIKGSDDYKATYYEEGRTYRAEEWLETYMQYYHSNTDTSLHLLAPSDLFAQLRGQAENQKAAQLYFDLRNTQVFKEGTRPETVEAFLSESEATRPTSARKYASHLTSSQLLFAGMVFPNDIEDPKAVPVVVDWSSPLMKHVSYINITDRTGRIIAQFGPRTGNLKYTISDFDAALNYWEVGLKDGVIFKLTYKYEDPTLGPPIKRMRPPNNPVAPPNPPVDPVLPLLPQLDEECNILPSYYNQPGTGLPYTATIEYPNPDPLRHLVVYEVVEYIHLGNGEFQEIWGVNEYYFDNSYTTPINRGVHGPNGQIRTAVYLNPYHAKLTKPIILTDGIDFLSNRGIDEIIKQAGGNDFISLLWDGGYDVIIADFAGGADFIQRNAFAFIELIRSLRQDQGVENIEAAIGPSMGGQIIRYALMYWEKNLSTEFGNHNLQVFVSADSPWTGANASPAVQAFADKNLNSNKSFLNIHTSANSPAARQLVLNHTFTQLKNEYYIAGQHSYKDVFENELELLGSKPKDVKKIIAIADGSGNGLSTNVPPSTSFLDFVFLADGPSLYSQCIFQTFLKGHSSPTMIIDKDYGVLGGYGISCKIANDKFPSVKSIGEKREFDSCPGSPFNLAMYFTAFKKGETISCEWGFKVKIADYHVTESFTFIPTYSALGMDPSQAFDNFFDKVTPSGNGYYLPGSPFDAVFFDDKDSDHNDISNGQQPGSLPFLLEQLSFTPIYQTKCLILDEIGLGSESITFYMEQPENQNFCLPFEASSITTTGNPECGIEFVFNGSEIEISTNGDEEPCNTTLTYCMDVVGCGQLCKDVEIIVSPGSSNKSVNLPDLSNTIMGTQETTSKIYMYPNPSTGLLNVDVYNEQDYGIVYIYNIYGRMITALRTQQKLDLSFLNNGVYTLVFKNKLYQKVLEQKLIIIK